MYKVQRKGRCEYMKAVDRLVVKLIADGAIEEEDREIYEYGFNQGIIMLVNMICTLLIGVVMGMFLEVLVFIVAYIPLRTFAGGFHAKTQVRCFVYSNLFVALNLYLVRVLQSYNYFLLVVLVLSIVCICLLAPVEDQNKPLDEQEVKLYGKKAKIILSGIILLIVFFHFIHFDRGSVTAIISIGSLSVILVMGYIKNLLLKK